MQTLNTIIKTPQFNKNNETVLFLHGWGGSTNSFLFAQNYIKSEFPTINLDFFGFGKSPQLKKPMDTYLYALAVYEFLVQNKIDTVSIVAHSFVRRIAVLLATIFHIRVKK